MCIRDSCLPVFTRRLETRRATAHLPETGRRRIQRWVVLIAGFWPHNIVKHGICCQNTSPSVRLCVGPSITWLNGSRYRNLLYTAPQNDVSSYVNKFRNAEFSTSLCTSALNRKTPSTAKIWPVVLDILETVRDRIKLLLLTRRKLHTVCRLVPKVVILNDLERRNDRYFSLFHRFRYIWGPITSLWLKLDSYCGQ